MIILNLKYFTFITHLKIIVGTYQLKPLRRPR